MKKIITIIMLLFAALQGYSQKQKPDKAYRIIEATYIGLNIADYALTINAISSGAREINPIAKKMSPYGMAGLKLASTASVVILGRMAYRQNPKAAKATMIAMNVLTGLVVTNNISVTIKLKK